jgi:ABC-2 type transport system permease protein
MSALVLFAVLLHGLSLTIAGADERSEQLMFVFSWGERFGGLFAGLLGVLSITGEYRYGTIRPTFLITPRRGRVIAAKIAVALGLGAALGLLAAVMAAGVGGALLAARGIDVRLDHPDFVLLVAGGTIASALWGALGAGLGALVRRQVPAIVGLIIWLLLVENLLVGFAPDAGRLMPGAAGAALAGLDPDTLLAPALGGLLLALYAAAAAAGGAATARRDV